MVRPLLFGTALQTAAFPAITLVHGQPAPPHQSTDPDLLPPNITDPDT